MTCVWCNQVCLHLHHLSNKDKENFFHKIQLERSTMDDDPLIHIVRLVLDYNDQVSRYISNIILATVMMQRRRKRQLKLNIANSTSNRLHFYKAVNPNLEVHDICTKNIKANHIKRVSWTRLRLKVHILSRSRKVAGTGGDGAPLPWRRGCAFATWCKPKHTSLKAVPCPCT